MLTSARTGKPWDHFAGPKRVLKFKINIVFCSLRIVRYNCASFVSLVPVRA